jgi:hypothetical protein
MAYIKPEWTEHQRRRWMRHDAHLWIRHDAHRWLRPDYQRFLQPGADPQPPLSLFEGKANFNPRPAACAEGKSGWRAVE